MIELIKYLIERLKNRPITSEALLVASILIVAFSIAQYFVSEPEAIAILYNCYFQATAFVTFSIWVASICWRYVKIRTLGIISTLTFLVVGMAGSTLIIRSSNIERLKIRIVFDESVDISPDAMFKLINVLESRLFTVEISEKPYSIATDSEGRITNSEVRTLFREHNLLKLKEDQFKPLAILLTGKMLESSNWINLLSTTWEDSIVISIYNVGLKASLSDVKVRRYVATSIALEALNSHSLRCETNTLVDRSPDLYKGCLYDFHRTRETYILQCQRPVLCDIEEKALTKIFGKAAVSNLKIIFAKITRDGSTAF